MAASTTGSRVRDPFSHLIYQLLVIEKRAPVAEVAATLGLSPSALYGRMQGRARFRVEEVRALIAVLDDQRLLRWFVDDSRFVVARRPRPDAVRRSVIDATSEALHGAVDLMRVVAKALDDGLPLDHRDRAAILTEVVEAETAIANLRAAVDHSAQRDQPLAT